MCVMLCSGSTWVSLKGTAVLWPLLLTFMQQGGELIKIVISQENGSRKQPRRAGMTLGGCFNQGTTVNASGRGIRATFSCGAAAYIRHTAPLSQRRMNRATLSL